MPVPENMHVEFLMLEQCNIISQELSHLTNWWDCTFVTIFGGKGLAAGDKMSPMLRSWPTGMGVPVFGTELEFVARTIGVVGLEECDGSRAVVLGAVVIAVGVV